MTVWRKVRAGLLVVRSVVSWGDGGWRGKAVGKWGGEAGERFAMVRRSGMVLVVTWEAARENMRKVGSRCMIRRREGYDERRGCQSDLKCA